MPATAAGVPAVTSTTPAPVLAADPAVAAAEVGQRGGEAGEAGGVVADLGAAQPGGFLDRGDGVSPVLLWHDGPSPPDGLPSTAGARGQTRPARLFRPSGRGLREEKVTIGIPPGIPEGATLRLAGRGMPSPVPGGPPGDAYARIRTRDDARFTRAGGSSADPG